MHIGFVWGNATPCSSKDGMVLKWRAPKSKVYIILLGFSRSLLVSIQAPTVSRHHDRASTALLNSLEAESYYCISSVY